jgi:hypothetical protein
MLLEIMSATFASTRSLNLSLENAGRTRAAFDDELGCWRERAGPLRVQSSFAAVGASWIGTREVRVAVLHLQLERRRDAEEGYGSC